jgi:hypothetical protein
LLPRISSRRACRGGVVSFCRENHHFCAGTGPAFLAFAAMCSSVRAGVTAKRWNRSEKNLWSSMRAGCGDVFGGAEAEYFVAAELEIPATTHIGRVYCVAAAIRITGVIGMVGRGHAGRLLVTASKLVRPRPQAGVTVC